jgi:hypothetical protein
VRSNASLTCLELELGHGDVATRLELMQAVELVESRGDGNDKSDCEESD